MAESHTAGAAAAASAAPAELLIEANGEKSVLRLEAPSYRLGRAATNQLAFPAISGLSREHLAIERDGKKWVARDLGSTNGSFLNGERLSEPRVLRSGDRVTADRVTLIYRDHTANQSQTLIFTEEAASIAASDVTMGESLKGLMAQESEVGGRHLQALVTAGRELSTHLPLNKLFELILDLSIEAVGAARGVVMTLESGELRVQAAKGQGLRMSSRVRDLVMEERRSLLVQDTALDSTFANRQSIVLSQIRSMIAVPLQTDDHVIGLIYLDSSHASKEFSKQDLNLLTVMANMAAVRIENARLAELEEAERLRAREMEQAALIQRSMLPQQFPTFPNRSEFDLHAAIVTAKEVGGDLFDFFLLSPDRLGFVVGDVSGKGVPAALFMAVARTVLRAAAHHEASPGACLTYMNNSLAEQNAAGMFVTLFYGILNTRSGLLEYSNAGHNPPYTFSAHGEIRVLGESCGPMLGFFPDLEYTTKSVQIPNGQAVLVFTDGVTEACSQSDEFFGEHRLESYLAAHATQTAEELVGGLLAEVERFQAGGPRADDVTVLAVRRL
jgi:serine phosphatase RsbU (regulator of sigma subunit)